ncbi:MAG: dethiobiotin synthase [Oscillospiraceae bacterium]|nr:dethiobiotin synthase [Oscillospiraceae bacterium]
MSKGIFVLGTKQNVGKTYISTLMFKKLFNMGLKVAYYKPVAMGVSYNNDIVCSKEISSVYNFCNIEANISDFFTYGYENNIQPYIASVVENKKINIDKIKQDFNYLCKHFDYIIVEGFSEILVPCSIEEDIMPIDIIKELDLGVVFISSCDEESVLNDTSLNISYLLSNNVDLKGIIFNRFNKESFVDIDNKKAIEMVTGIATLTTIGNNEIFFNILGNKLKSMFSDVILDDINLDEEDIEESNSRNRFDTNFDLNSDCTLG